MITASVNGSLGEFDRPVLFSENLSITFFMPILQLRRLEVVHPTNMFTFSFTLVE